MSSADWKDTHQEEMKAYRRKHYHRNKAAYLARAKKQNEAKKQWNKDLKSSLQCSRCPESFWACLDFHHTDPTRKDVTINKALSIGWSKERILTEIAKCEVLCANCHRKLHHSEIAR